MRTAVVVGAGIAGLAAAGALARTGWQVTLLERDDRVRAARSALILWPNGIRALRALGLGDGLDAIATPLPDMGVRRPDGHWLVQPRPTTADRAPVVVHREDLHDALVAGLGDRVDIRTGVTVDTVRARSDGRPAVGVGRTTVEADLLVGADGIDSTVRRRLAPASSVVSSGCTAWRAVIPWYRAPRLADDRPVTGETLGAGYRFVAASLGERGSAGGSSRGGIYWVATAAGAPRPEQPATQLALLRRWFADWPAPIGELLAATEPDDLVQQEVRELRPLPREYGFPAGSGGVVLIGDAAHAMPHHLGQGACLGFEDAATLRSAVRDAAPGEALREAVRAYTRLRRPRTVTIVRQTRRMSAVLQARGRLALRARDAALGTITPRLMGSASSVAAQWTPPA
ncbi:2-polyprenyl-6-methoxyphenol hydroxylase [Micromonospora pattaloongensis]|uniref:2-polyprenyl-6-methoxyphenol hydroxylase n=1 Tax=Micromonospora pattaloongensis TaxID=405436 RepID=A0A1H3Q625_9ACTN|nr:NAD(P)/FAD-dependent oxidoreductase [Micromonospora pattaloongensis]SDZ08992.1 2-polyprenyl-6-methoxyphenol hydroxylase [Micromonospora pattaloongensis]